MPLEGWGGGKLKKESLEQALSRGVQGSLAGGVSG